MLLMGRIDLSLNAKIAGMHLLHNKFSPEEAARIAYSTKPLIIQPQGLLFSKKTAHSKELMARFNRGLKELREDGTYDKMLTSLLKGQYEQFYETAPQEHLK